MCYYKNILYSEDKIENQFAPVTWQRKWVLWYYDKNMPICISVLTYICLEVWYSGKNHTIRKKNIDCTIRRPIL